ncbi:FUSC family protein [Mucilaginibacter auburnensis]|uniref:Putative membrane protein YccC n=1 Tax=Mucilaginibacter auburnensis TaxID=1457233 RepID=A0A2H9VQL3_9SPHI|nr:FUSC family membrane protein [Mucilaginibacter auburnensis]PJJ83083.1 putative membrane protein YccC [Mucilaginibacter auburnensis]
MNGTHNKSPLHFRLPENVIDALRNVALIILPLLIGYRHAPELTSGMATGVLIVSLTDLPGNRQRKIKTAWQSILVAAVVSVCFNCSLVSPVATGLVLLIFSFLLALWNGFGAAAGAVGMSGVAMMIFMLGLRPVHPIQFSAYMIVGALLFHAVVLLQSYLRPFSSLRQELQGLLQLTADFLMARADCYDPDVPLDVAYQRTMKLHLMVTAKQDAVRQLLLTDRKAMQQAGEDVQQLIAIATITMQLYEHFIATPLDHGQLREVLSGSETLKHITTLIRRQAKTLHSMSALLPFGRSVRSSDEDQATEGSLRELAIQGTEEESLLINAVLQNVHTVKLLLATMSTPQATKANLPTDQLQRFLPDSKTFKETFIAQLHWRSPLLRFSLRLALMLFVAYCAVFAFTKDHYNYWFLLTIMVVSRPRVAVTWQRNLERVSGTVAGLVVAYVLLALIASPAALLTIVCVCMAAFFALNRSRYDKSVFAITICAVLFASVYSGGSSGVLYARLLYTLAGCALAMAGIFLFPVWVKAELDAFAKGAVMANAKLLNAVANGESEVNIRLARKEAHQQIAGLFEGLKHSQIEPGVQNLSGLKQILLLNYRLNSVILSFFLFDGAVIDKQLMYSAKMNLQRAISAFSDQNTAVAVEKDNQTAQTLLESLTRELLLVVQAYNFERYGKVV